MITSFQTLGAPPMRYIPTLRTLPVAAVALAVITFSCTATDSAPTRTADLVLRNGTIVYWPNAIPW